MRWIMVNLNAKAIGVSMEKNKIDLENVWKYQVEVSDSIFCLTLYLSNQCSKEMEMDIGTSTWDVELGYTYAQEDTLTIS